MNHPQNKGDSFSDVDQDALQRCMEMARHEPGRAEQLDSMLRDGRPWSEVADLENAPECRSIKRVSSMVRGDTGLSFGASAGQRFTDCQLNSTTVWEFDIPQDDWPAPLKHILCANRKTPRKIRGTPHR
jgi:hypothetical protein